MITTPFLDRQADRSARTEILLGYAERRALEAQESAERKRLEHEQQCAFQNPPEVRIRAWETVHQLRMPSTQLHPVLTAIAAATQLTLAEVRAEQQRRCGQRASADV
jgi:hypothetical protein